MEHGIYVDLPSALEAAAMLEPVPVTDTVLAQVLEFISGRLRAILLDLGHKYDAVDAVLAAQAKNPAGAACAIRQLSTWVARPDWSTLLQAYARCVRITRDQKEKFILKPKAFIETSEKRLFDALEKAENQDRSPGSVDDFLNAFLPMIPAVNEFFDKILVMAEDRSIKENRLGLLQRITSLADGIADLGKLEGF
jgi:glycyl-tRNA synthetase